MLMIFGDAKNVFAGKNTNVPLKVAVIFFCLINLLIAADQGIYLLPMYNKIWILLKFHG